MGFTVKKCNESFKYKQLKFFMEIMNNKNY